MGAPMMVQRVATTVLVIDDGRLRDHCFPPGDGPVAGDRGRS
jgi:hypothetical protein